MPVAFVVPAFFCNYGLMKRAFTCLILLSPFFVFAQHDSLNGSWTNGWEIFSSEKINDSIWGFSGGSLHEGGSYFAVRVDRNNSLSIAGRLAEDGDAPTIGQRKDKIEYKVFDSVRLLVVIAPNGEIRDCLRSTGPGESLWDVVVNSKIRYELSGRYINPANNHAVVFYPDKRVAEGLWATNGYKFEENYDVPEDVITFGKGHSFYYVKTDSGLLIYKALSVGDEFWEKGAKLMVLKKTAFFNLSGGVDSTEQYAFASAIILTKNILGSFTPNQLKWMRNGIFARHGLIFTTDDMKKHFAAQPWYTPQFINVDDKLTALERLNIRLIKQFEQRKTK
jgi:hypothetical protein